MSKMRLEPGKRNPEVEKFEASLKTKIIGQNEAVSALVDIYEMIIAGMTIPRRPIANLLFLGPTGSGKTRIIEAATEILFENPKAFIKVDCAEFQHSHEIAKLIGSPPGYIGHRETHAVLNQGAIDHFQTESLKMTFLLFDEIEKANDALWHLLLGVLDKGTLTLGDNQKVDLSRTVVVMTSNLGSEKMSRAMTCGIGFTTSASTGSERQIDNIAINAAKGHFSPEFMNRLDKVIVFRSLSDIQLRQILDIELALVQSWIISMHINILFVFNCTQETKEFLIRQGTDLKYGARPLKRAIEHHILPFARLISTEQIKFGDKVIVELSEDSLVFYKETKSITISANS